MKCLLHVCCGPCSIAIFKELKQQFDELVVHFYNPNIHPRAEYDLRLAEVMRICDMLNIALVEEMYNPEDWFEWAKEDAEEKEGGERCSKCFAFRLEKSAEYAGKHGFDYYATSLTTGRNKRADVINPIGEKFGEKYGVKFFNEDWKKGGRQELKYKLVKEMDIYSQDYCGCIYSKKEREEQKKKFEN